MNKESPEFTPFVPAERSINEFTFRAVILGCLLSLIFSAGIAFLGLRVGLTVSASVPAAVVSMVILRSFFRNATILENNIVQTLASAGESLAGAVIFTIPAFIFLGAPLPWWKVAIICVLGGILGVLLMVPLRQHLIVKEHGKLPFPEGTACAEILKAGEKGGKEGVYVLWGSLAGLTHKFLTSALHLWEETPRWVVSKFQNTIFSVEPSTALMGVGYIIGPRFSAITFSGGFLAWFVLIPLIHKFGTGLEPILPAMVPVSQMSADAIWSAYIRYIGTGAILVGGFFSLLKAAPILKYAVKLAFIEISAVFQPKKASLKRTEQNISMIWVALGILAIALALCFIPGIELNPLAVLIVIVLGFFFVTVTSQIVGIVGSSTNPISGMLLTTLFITTSVFLSLGWKENVYLLAAMLVTSVVSMTIAIAADTSQDLKTGFLVGATPKKQQIAEIIGVLVASLIMGGVLSLLDQVYVLGSEKLPAPQATMMAQFSKAVMSGDAPWELILIGVCFGIILELIKIPALPFALGIYLPISLASPIMIGGTISLIIAKLSKKCPETEQRGILLSSGLVAGEALMGVLIALGAILGWINLEIPPKFGAEVSLFVFLIIAIGFTVASIKKKKKNSL